MSTLFYYGEIDSVIPKAFDKVGLSFNPVNRADYLTQKEYRDGLAWHYCVTFPSYKKDELVAAIKEVYREDEYAEEHSEFYIQESCYEGGEYYTLSKE